MSDTMTTPDVKKSDGDHDLFSHIVVPASAVTEAYITGKPVTALCGKTWVPSRDPKNHQVCPSCKEIFDEAIRLKYGDNR